MFVCIVLLPSYFCKHTGNRDKKGNGQERGARRENKSPTAYSDEMTCIVLYMFFAILNTCLGFFIFKRVNTGRRRQSTKKKSNIFCSHLPGVHYLVWLGVQGCSENRTEHRHAGYCSLAAHLILLLEGVEYFLVVEGKQKENRKEGIFRGQIYFLLLFCAEGKKHSYCSLSPWPS